MARYHGKKGRILASTTGTGTATPLSSMASWTLNMETDKEETTSFGDANKTYVQGLADISGDFSGFFDDSDAALYTGAASADGVKLYLYPDYTNAPTKYWYGPAWLDFSVEAPVDGAVTVSGSFAANGSWGRF
jgi:hypothetical protein